MTRVLLVEDEPKLSSCTARFVRRAGFSVDCTATVLSMSEAMQCVVYNCLIVDRVLPDGDGLEALRLSKLHGLTSPILMLSARRSLNDRLEGLNAGADDYLCKPFDGAELIARIRALLRRAASSVQRQLSAGNLSYDLTSQMLRIAGEVVIVSRRELMLLEQLIRRVGQTLTQDQIENSLYGFDESTTRNAIEASVSRLRKTLAAGGADHKIHTVRGIGYCLAP